MRTDEWEGGGVVIERGRLPSIRGVAASAAGAQLSIMCIIPCMAGKAIGWGSFESFGSVTFFAGNKRMPACQLESDRTVVKCGRLPARGSMALGADCPQLTGVDIILGMAHAALRRCAYE